MSDRDSAGEGSSSLSKRKRAISDAPPPRPIPVATPKDAEDTSSDDDIGPTLPPAGGSKKKKRRTLPHEKLYLSAMPSSPRYSKSLMHRDNLSFVTMTPFTDFLITTSADGVVKFWKKVAVGIEFVKMFRAHTADIVSVNVSSDGRCFATAGADNRVAVFDVDTFDLLTTLTLPNTPRAICWVHKRGSSLPLLAISDTETTAINIYDGRPESMKVLATLPKLHRAIVHLMSFNDKYDTVVSCDEGGMIEYWSPHSEREFEKPSSVFVFKSDTSLLDFKRAKSVPSSLAISPTCEQFATFSYPDRQVRVFDFSSAKLYRSYDESISTLTTIQQAASSDRKLPDLEFGRRIAVETDLTSLSSLTKQNIIFDESGYFIIYGSLAGIKILNMTTNTLPRLLSAEEGIRPMHLAIYQGAPKKKSLMTVEMAASANPLLNESTERDPMIVCTAYQKPRFYIFTNDSSASKSERDILNEKPAQANQASAGPIATTVKQESGQAAIMHTSLGDIHVRLFPEAAPKTVENFVTHARSQYYNGTIFHRVIKKFMIQGGDPLGDGTGGESIWGGEFEDEFSTLKHDKPYTLSMANAGPNTNGSQFFITTEKTPWLDNRHTIFGRATQGLDVVHKIENVRTFKEKPEDDVKIISITVL
ncbi:unnamed protein product [Tuber melanosporum]|uniref:Peptidyl-prolyl cis-trans isomerase-like 1 n=1 Tax=Tuber melanosporum (strain Mel28) TaxID=656061 RepID=D5GHG7_TUBMM|nr:uncharacterized protein GSTUM_00007865001 [Tuber melanosporum]CAZ83960.1 unnamed protein product [Tuber melanosporum]